MSVRNHGRAENNVCVSLPNRNRSDIQAHCALYKLSTTITEADVRQNSKDLAVFPPNRHIQADTELKSE